MTDATAWLQAHGWGSKCSDGPTREPLPEQMEPGDVDDMGRILTDFTPAPLVAHGRVWVRPDQAFAAEYYGWQTIHGLVASKADGATLWMVQKDPA